MLIMIASRRKEELREFIQALESEPDIETGLVNSGEAALVFARTEAPELVIIDEALPDFKPFKLATELLQINAMINTAVITPLSDEDFHEQSEGLGILLAIASPPGREDAQAVIEKLRGLYPAGRS